MLRATTVDDQLANAANDPLRVLIVGAGMAGLTLAQLLRGRGLHPVLLDRAGADASRGYMLALLPLVDPLIRELGLTDEYLHRSQSFWYYRLRGRHGAMLREYEMGEMVSAYGNYQGISRAKLLELLALDGGDVTYGATVTALRQLDDRAEVAISEQAGRIWSPGDRPAEFDLVVVADGLRSATRNLLLERRQVRDFDTGWGGWVTWMDSDERPGLGEELWGDDVFLGTYPVRDRMGIFLGGPRDRSQVGADSFAASARERLGVSVGSEKASLVPRVDRALSAVATSDDCYYWPMVDCRADRWTFDRALLLGDAAAGFLPTAGIGAAMAMESAWVLAHHLDRVIDRSDTDVPSALRAYERAQRPRVEAAQTNSRSLAGLMFRGGAVFSAVRDLATRVVPIRTALKPIRSLLEEKPDLGTHGRTRA